MSVTVYWVLSLVVAYLVGAVPFGFLIARARGVDIRTVGSGNVGATNVFRSVSKALGLITFALDAFKGFAGVVFVPRVVAALSGMEFAADMRLAVVCGAMTVVGHNWTCFLRFKGGKGVATSAGFLLGVTPAGVGIAFGVWLVVFVAWRYVSVASIVAALVLSAVVWVPLRLYVEHGWWLPAVLSGLGVLAVWKHRSNMVRLMAGTESRFEFGRKRSGK